MKIALGVSVYFLERLKCKNVFNLLFGHEHTFRAKSCRSSRFCGSLRLCVVQLLHSVTIIHSVEIWEENVISLSETSLTWVDPYILWFLLSIRFAYCLVNHERMVHVDEDGMFCHLKHVTYYFQTCFLYVHAIRFILKIFFEHSAKIWRLLLFKCLIK